MSKKYKAVFFDRDGTINVKLPENRYVTRWEEFEFLPDVFDVLRAIKHRGYLTILVTNQRGIGRKLMTEQQLQDIHQKMQNILMLNECPFDLIFYCPHDIHENCSCRKPQPGMLIKAEQYYPITRERSFMVGDSAVDIEAGRRFGVRTIQVGSWDGAADYSVMELKGILKIII
ncbi:MAG TPA: HAD family hydrolase [Clostridiales bacterium]|nr:HAD family hydrolase [Clostridiales bacterium]